MSIFANCSMKRFYHILRALLIALFAIVLGTPMAIYVITSLPSVQQHLCKAGENELSKLLGTEVDIESIGITPFNRVSASNVTILDDFKKEALNIEHLDAGIDLYELFLNDKIVITHAAIIGLDAKIYQTDSASQLNIHNIIERLKPKDKNKPPTNFDLRINSVVIRDSQASFNVLSKPTNNNCFDKNHINISNLNADIYIPQLKNDDFIFNIKRFSLEEQAGIKITDLHGNFHIASTGINVIGLELSLNKSHLAFSDINISVGKLSDISKKLDEIPINVSLLNGSHINLNDLHPIVPQFKNIDEQLNIALSTKGKLNDLKITSLEISHNSKTLKLSTSGNIVNVRTPQKASVRVQLQLQTTALCTAVLIFTRNVKKKV